MRWLGYAWDLAAWGFLLSVASASLIGLVRKARARSKRLFRDLPMQRLQGMHPDTRIDHRWDA
jgi:hypothetical protein